MLRQHLRALSLQPSQQGLPLLEQLCGGGAEKEARSVAGRLHGRSAKLGVLQGQNQREVAPADRSQRQNQLFTLLCVLHIKA